MPIERDLIRGDFFDGFSVVLYWCLLILIFAFPIAKVSAGSCTDRAFVDAFEGSVKIQKQGEAAIRDIVLDDVVCREDKIFLGSNKDRLILRAESDGLRQVYKEVPISSGLDTSLDDFLTSIWVQRFIATFVLISGVIGVLYLAITGLRFAISPQKRWAGITYKVLCYSASFVLSYEILLFAEHGVKLWFV